MDQPPPTGLGETKKSPFEEVALPAPPAEIFRIFIGFDPRQWCSYTALSTSIIEQTSQPVSIMPLVLGTLPINRQGLTPFTYSRFLVPWLCGFVGQGLFIDTDTLFLEDPVELFRHWDPQFSVQVVPFEGEFAFERASVLLWNCEHPDNRILTPAYIQDPEKCKAPHVLDWTTNAGPLPAEFNHLVGYQEKMDEDPALLHFTQGVPAYPETDGCDWHDVWGRAMQISVSSAPWLDLMGQSVHTKKLPDGRLVPKLYGPAQEALSKQREEMGITPVVGGNSVG